MVPLAQPAQPVCFLVEVRQVTNHCVINHKPTPHRQRSRRRYPVLFEDRSPRASLPSQSNHRLAIGYHVRWSVYTVSSIGFEQFKIGPSVGLRSKDTLAQPVAPCHFGDRGSLFAATGGAPQRLVHDAQQRDRRRPTMERPARFQVMIVDEYTVLGIASPQAAQNRRMPTLGTFDSQAMVVQELVNHLGKSLVLFQRAETPAVKLLHPSLNRAANLLLQNADLL